MVARQQDFRDRPPLPVAWLRVLRVFEQAVLEALGLPGFDSAHHARDQPDAGVEAVQLEIAQAAYLVEARQPRYEPARARPLQFVLRALLSQFHHGA